MRTACASSRSGSRRRSRSATRRAPTWSPGLQAGDGDAGQGVLVAIGQPLALSPRSSRGRGPRQDRRRRARWRARPASPDGRCRPRRRPHRWSGRPPGAGPGSRHRIPARPRGRSLRPAAPPAAGRAPGAAARSAATIVSGQRSAAIASRVRGRRVSARIVSNAWACRPFRRTSAPDSVRTATRPSSVIQRDGDTAARPVTSCPLSVATSGPSPHGPDAETLTVQPPDWTAGPPTTAGTPPRGTSRFRVMVSASAHADDGPGDTPRVG